MNSEQRTAAASLLRETAFTLRKLAELPVDDQPLVQSETPNTAYVVDLGELRKLADEQ